MSSLARNIAKIALYPSAMATDSAALTQKAPGQPPSAQELQRRRRSDTPKIDSPARPILQGVGLDAPFFQDKNRAFWILQGLGWTGYFILRSLTGFANNRDVMWIVHTALLTATGYSLTLLMGALFRRLIKLKVIWTALLSLVAVVVAAMGFSVIETWSNATFVNPAARPVGIQYLGAILLNFSLLAAWTALYYGINYYILLEEQITQRERLESQASSAQLAMLRYQLNPHFLFNTLNSISTLVLLKQTERANAMLARLSSFLRYTLANESAAKVTLAQEVETLKLYLEIEKMRFEDRMRPHFRIDPDTIGARLPSLLLQPLIENAIKYAVTPSEDGADIWLTASREGNAVRIEVADNGGGAANGDFAATQSTGVGLANIKERLAQAYGNAHGFTTKKNEHGGFSVIIEIPYQSGDEG